MKPKTYNLKAFGWHIYASRERLRFAPMSNQRGNGLARRLRELRNNRYKKKHGCCELCGQPHEKSAMSLHHILPFGEFPNLSTRKWNLLMLCPRCHFVVHVNLFAQVRLMERTARQHGIDLEREYQRAAAQRWTEKQEKKGGAA